MCLSLHCTRSCDRFHPPNYISEIKWRVSSCSHYEMNLARSHHVDFVPDLGCGRDTIWRICSVPAATSVCPLQRWPGLMLERRWRYPSLQMHLRPCYSSRFSQSTCFLGCTCCWDFADLRSALAEIYQQINCGCIFGHIGCKWLLGNEIQAYGMAVWGWLSLIWCLKGNRDLETSVDWAVSDISQLSNIEHQSTEQYRCD